MSAVTCQLSLVSCHLSAVTCHMLIVRALSVLCHESMCHTSVSCHLGVLCGVLFVIISSMFCVSAFSFFYLH